MKRESTIAPALCSNRLQHEKSPYLLQHAHNPVNWYPWGDAAFSKAEAENKPIFLSIGYATCHWCHVMEKESFEDQAVADLLNRDYICIKVDREERPDIDQVYMDVCVRLTGSGGWPLTIFMTPDKKPFFAGTYFPKESYLNRPGLIDYLPLVATRWEERPEEFRERAEQVVSALKTDVVETQIDNAPIGDEVLARATKQLMHRFDPADGGFGDAPKFPSPHNLAYLLRRHRRTGDKQLLQAVEITLHAMRQGGLYDQVGFGFHRYSTDSRWLVPHFEKMLYDQAGLAQLYSEAYQVTKEPIFARTAHEICIYVLRDLTGKEGGFYSAQDADSEGEEGKFYLWTAIEVMSLLGEEAGSFFCGIFNLSENGNYRDESSQEKTGFNIPYMKDRIDQIAQARGVSVDQLIKQIDTCRKKLFSARKQRIPPLTDDKILTAWNGMMISALASAGRILDERKYISAAETAADFILTTVRSGEGKLQRRYRDGEAAIDAFAEDYAFLAKGLLDLYRATFKPERLQQAIDLAEQLVVQFMDRESGLIYETPDTNRELIVRPKNLFDGAHPSTHSIALQLFIRLNLLTGDAIWRERSELLLAGLAPKLNTLPAGFTCALQGVALLLEPTRELLLTGEEKSKGLSELIVLTNQIFAPETSTTVQYETNGANPEFKAETERQGQSARAYICHNFSCLDPVTDRETLAAALRKTV